MELGRPIVSLRNPDTRVGRAGVAGTAALTAFVLLVSGCGDSSGNQDHSPAASGQTSGRTAGNPSSHESGHAQLTFDYLGGGSKVIEVFPGVGNTPEDKKFDGTYYDGESVTADCQTDGREVHSDPSIGEQKRQSDVWFLIEGTPGETQYATAVYTQNPHQLTMELPEC
jgi:hypothetical protein